MSRRCELMGKTAQVGHKVSHSNIKTKRRFLPNLLNVTLISDTLGRSVRLRVSAHALKTVDHRGGLDAFLLKANDDDLSIKALDLKRQIRKKKQGGRGLPDEHNGRRRRSYARNRCADAWRRSGLAFPADYDSSSDHRSSFSPTSDLCPR